MFETLTKDEINHVDGGELALGILGALDGACVGLGVAAISCFIVDDWKYEDTMNCIKTGASVGFTIGLLV